jgi:hypothetical protein
VDIKTALSKLDHNSDNDWLANGSPSLARIQAITNNTAISQEALDAEAGNFKRKTKAVKDREAAEDKAGRKEVKDKMMVATKRGFYGGAIRDEGDSFLFSGVPGSWMIEDGTAEAKEVKAEAERAKIEKAKPKPFTGTEPA